MVLEAYALGISSCIIGRAEATFSNLEMAALLPQWDLDGEHTLMVFVCLSYIDGEYPKIKARNDGRAIWPSET